MELLSLMVVLFLVFWEIHTVSHSGCNNLQPHQQRVRVCFSLHPCWHLLFVLFLMMAILTGLRWYIIMVSICIPLETDDIKNLYRCLLYMSSLGKKKNVYPGLLPTFKLSCFFWCWVVWTVYVLSILTKSLSVIWFTNIF